MKRLSLFLASAAALIAAPAANGASAQSARLTVPANARPALSGRESAPAPKISTGAARGSSSNPASAVPARMDAITADTIRPIAARPGVPATNPSTT